MNNTPDIKLGLVAVSRDCFPIELSKRRKNDVLESCKKLNVPIHGLETIIENEKDVLTAMEEICNKGINALVIYLGNFGPEGPTTLLAQKFTGPVMFSAAAEESKDKLIQNRGDAFCGMLSTSYSTGLRNLRPYIPEYPVGTAEEIADMIKDFIPIARIILGLKKLKIFSFGPRPHDFLTCNAPIKPLFNIGVEIMENSELDLYDIYRSAEGHPEVKKTAADMIQELGEGNTYPDLIDKLAQYEVALMNFFRDNLGASEFGVFANKCWPAFEHYFGFVPCYINARLAARGIPVSCEVDIYGVLSEYIATCATELPATILDINNTVPEDMYRAAKNQVGSYKPTDLFIGFHCGNTAVPCMLNPEIKFQLIMNRLLESGQEPNITRGTLEGRIRPGEITIFRLQSTAETELRAYIAEGEILDINPKSFGSTGVFAVEEMGRFYRHVLIEKRFPHHTSVAFKHCGKVLFEAMKMLGTAYIGFNYPKGFYYPSENPFC